VEESRTYLRSCRLCCSALHNAHIAGTFGNIRHRGVCWSGTSLLWSLSTRRSTNLPAQLLLSPLLLIACVRHEATLADTNNLPAAARPVMYLCSVSTVISSPYN
jgi:hypothetical protein